MFPFLEEVRQYQNPQDKVMLVFSSQKSIQKNKENHMHIHSLEEAFQLGIDEGFEEVMILPLHVVGGRDYDELVLAAKNQKQLRVEVVSPLMTEDEGLERLASKLIPFLDSHIYLIIGHGTQDASNERYARLEAYLIAQHIPCMVATLSHKEDEIYHKLKKLVSLHPNKKIVVFPLFTIAGYHVKKDLYDSEYGLIPQLMDRLKETNQELKWEWIQTGLLFDKEIRMIYIDKLRKMIAHK
jgi:sirohydrochlorin cobaltochelatase